MSPNASHVLVLVLFLAISACAPPTAVAHDPRPPHAIAKAPQAPRPEIPPAVTVRPWQEETEREVGAALRSIHLKLLACYAKRLAAQPRARAHMTLDVFLGEDGRPLHVATTGGAALGPDVVACIVRSVRTAPFSPPRGGGTARVHVPLSFHPGTDVDG